MKQDLVMPKIARAVIIGITIALFIFTGYMTLELVWMILPAALWWLGVLALASFDAGALAWALALKHGSHNGWMKVVAGAIMFIDILGCGFSWVSSMIIQASGEKVANLKGGILITVAAVLGVVIFLNASLGILFWLLDRKEENPPIGRPITGTRYRVLRPVHEQPAQPEYTQMRPLPEMPQERELPAHTATEPADFFTFDARTLGKQLKLKKMPGKK